MIVGIRLCKTQCYSEFSILSVPGVVIGVVVSVVEGNMLSNECSAGCGHESILRQQD